MTPLDQGLNPDRPAIVLAAFGAGEPDDLSGVLAVYRRIAQAFPDAMVHPAFTSRVFRDRWRRRADDPAWRADHPQLPDFLYHIQSPLARLANLSDMGVRSVVVQSLHVFAGEEYSDLKNAVTALDRIEAVKPAQRPFHRIVLGRPALGEPGPARPYTRDLEAAARALEADVLLARTQRAALVYVGHGNEFFSTGYYSQFEAELRRAYPDLPIFVGVVEGFPDPNVTLERVQRAGIRNVLLVPLLMVVGRHARADVNGDGDHSWRKRIEAAGIHVQTLLRPLGELEPWANLYVRHIEDAIKDHGLE
jgi:sirohydrochlorin cobaltochelatase